ncbi:MULTISPECIES: glycosyltransferase family 2 protein [Streptomyces]|uniref:Glycosyl transferase n=2 Tax=Streptomyces TaxID=1883 RepID=A0A100Y4Q4_9ACTN|nr:MULTISPECIES: glycosyltransferase [Streptomyces]KUH37644.1 glycosyl transferase [Streptomyces kanasensis]UUS31031.1 glycosyltransferase [Streptomyces changanensis]
MTRPDVTVVVAVYNTMPYLTECLNSLVKQSIGRDRLEVVAVDDGSTDDSGRELDRFAERYPGVVKVIHQANSGGPAAPSNRALEVATGRYVYFIGSDDHLGREALERMVDYADRHDSDVVVGKMVGTNGRYVHQALFQRNDPDVSLYDSALPFTLANTKLFRRDLVEQHKLRFPEDLPVGSDQPFTIEACVRARKVSVLADYTCYYAVKRGDSSNITYRADHLSRLRCTARIMEHAAGLIEAGPQRDAVFVRHFTWELAKLIQDDFPSLDAATRTEVCAGIAELADAYFTEALRDSMDVKRRVRIALAQRGALDHLVRAIEDEAAHGAPPLLLEDGRAYVRYPGFRDPALGLPDRLFEVIGEAVPRQLADGTRLVSAAWEQSGDDLAVSLAVRVPVTGETDTASVRLAAKALPKSTDKPGGRRVPVGVELPARKGESSQEPAPDGTGTHLLARIPLQPARAKLGVRAYLDVAGSTYEIPVKTQGVPLPLARRWREKVPYRVSATANAKGRLVITTAPLWEPSPGAGLRLRRVLSRVKRKLTR